MNTGFIYDLIKKFQREDIQIYITDANARILVCTDDSRVGTFGDTAHYITTVQHAVSILDTASLHNKYSRYGTPVLSNGAIKYIVVTYGNDEYTMQVGDSLQIALQAVVDYQESKYQKSNQRLEDLEEIAVHMLSVKPDLEKLYDLMERNHLEISKPRFVIQIYLAYLENFEKNCVPVSEERLQATAIKCISQCECIQSQDLIYSPDLNTVLVLKSVLEHGDVQKTYQDIERICSKFIKALESVDGITFAVTYGSYYRKPEKMHMSWIEAREIFALGKYGEQKSFYSLNDLFFEHLFMHLVPYVKARYLTPVEEKLFQYQEELPIHLIANAEAYVDNHFHLTTTAAQTFTHRNTVTSYLKQFSSLTGLDPVVSFRDAVLTKLLAINLRKTTYYKSTLHIEDRSR